MTDFSIVLSIVFVVFPVCLTAVMITFIIVNGKQDK